MTTKNSPKKVLKKEVLVFLMMTILIGKRSPPLIKVKKISLIEFKICVTAGNRSWEIVTHQIFYLFTFKSINPFTLFLVFSQKLTTNLGCSLESIVS